MKQFPYHWILPFFVAFFFNINACKSGGKVSGKNLLPDTSLTESASEIRNFTLDSMSTINIKGHFVDVMTPSGRINGNIIVLPGWSFSRKDWCVNSSLCAKALSRGYRLILPEMGKSVYSAKFYPETRTDWQVFPNKEWCINELIPTLQKDYHILTGDQKNYLIGLSTGGRGVALLALAKPDVFRAGAALSGDFDQTLMPTDNLMVGFYGTYSQFKDRWEGEDNPTRQADKFKTALYLGHGKQDKIVPVSQTEVFYQALKRMNPTLKVKLNLVDAVHDYKYWDSEVENILNFFGEIN